MVAALEELRMADRILMGVAGSRGQLGDQRAWDAVIEAGSRIRGWWRSGEAKEEEERSALAYTFAEIRQLNTELLAAQLAIGRVRASLGLPPEPVFELPPGASGAGPVRTVEEDRAQVEAIRATIRPLFARLLARAPALAGSVAPLAPLESPREVKEEWDAGASGSLHADALSQNDVAAGGERGGWGAPRVGGDDDPEVVAAGGERGRWGEPQVGRDDEEEVGAGPVRGEQLLAIDVVLGLVGLVGHVGALIVSGLAAPVVVSAVVAVPAWVYVIASGLRVLRGAREAMAAALTGHAVVVGLAVLAMLAFAVAFAVVGAPAPGRYAPGVLTLLGAHALRLRAAAEGEESDEETLTIGVGLCVLVELGMAARLLAG